jgi:hypothetical protein
LLKNGTAVCVGGVSAGAGKRCVRQQQRDEIMQSLVSGVNNYYDRDLMLMLARHSVDKKQSFQQRTTYYQAIKKARQGGRIGKTKQHRHIISIKKYCQQ